MKKLIILIFVALLLFCLQNIQAQDQHEKYLSFKGGIFFPNSDTDGMKDFDNGFNLEFAGGMAVIDNVLLQLGIGRYSAGFSTMHLDYDIAVIPVTLSGIYSFPAMDKLTVFGGAGIGYYFAKAEAKVNYEGQSFTDSDSDSTFGFNLLLGTDYYFADNISAGAEWKYIFAKISEDGHKFNIGGMTLGLSVKYWF